jgi:hypothetical protein
MARRVVGFLISLLFLTACTDNGSTPPDLPKMIAPDWQLGSVTPANMAAESELLRSHAKASWVVLYRGENTALVRIYRMKGSASGLDLVQRWQPAPNSVVFYTPKYFVTVDWTVNDREALRMLVAKLEQVLKG